MSEWYDPTDEDIEIDPESLNINIFVKQDDWGSVYVTLSHEQIKRIYEQIFHKP